MLVQSGTSALRATSPKPASLLEQRAEHATKLRTNLVDPTLRSALKPGINPRSATSQSPERHRSSTDLFKPPVRVASPPRGPTQVLIMTPPGSPETTQTIGVSQAIDASRPRHRVSRAPRESSPRPLSPVPPSQTLQVSAVSRGRLSKQPPSRPASTGSVTRSRPTSARQPQDPADCRQSMGGSNANSRESFTANLHGPGSRSASGLAGVTTVRSQSAGAIARAPAAKHVAGPSQQDPAISRGRPRTGAAAGVTPSQGFQTQPIPIRGKRAGGDPAVQHTNKEVCKVETASADMNASGLTRGSSPDRHRGASPARFQTTGSGRAGSPDIQTRVQASSRPGNRPESAPGARPVTRNRLAATAPAATCSVRTFAENFDISQQDREQTDVQMALRNQLQEARARLADIEKEKKELLDNGLSATSIGSPPAKASTASVTSLGSQVPESSRSTPLGATVDLGGGVVTSTGTTPPQALPGNGQKAAWPTSKTQSDMYNSTALRSCSTPVVRAVPSDGDSTMSISRNPSSPEKPKWLLADGRLLTARLEGENEALKRAVGRARLEINELESRRLRCDELNRALAKKNASAEQVSRALRFCQEGASAAVALSSTVSGSTNVPLFPREMSRNTPTSAAASLRQLVFPGAASSPPSSCGGGASACRRDSAAAIRSSSPSERSRTICHHAVAGATMGAETKVTQDSLWRHMIRERLLEKGEEFERRMKEIISKRSEKVQAEVAIGEDPCNLLCTSEKLVPVVSGDEPASPKSHSLLAGSECGWVPAV